MSFDTHEAPSANRSCWYWLVGGLLVVCGCCTFLMVLATAVSIYDAGRWDEWVNDSVRDPTPWPTRPLPSDLPTPAITAVSTPTPAPLPPSQLSHQPPAIIQQQPPPAAATADLARLYRLDFPPRDYNETAVRLGGHSQPRAVGGHTYRIGDQQTVTLESGPITAELLVVGQQATFWVEQGLNVDINELRAVAQRLDAVYYPQLVALFGHPSEIGLDANGRFAILHTRLGLGLEYGYFSSADLYSSALFKTTNEQAIIYLNIDELELGSDEYYATLIHELQHLSQWYIDPNEKWWLDEGLAQLAELYLGYDLVDTMAYFDNPAVSLTHWPDDGEDILPHYGAAYLFLVYFWEQLGETAVQELIRHPANGTAAVWSVLQGFAPERPLPDFFADWAVTNYLNSPTAPAPYHYRTIEPTGFPHTAHILESTPISLTSRLPQFGVEYVALNLSGPITLSFAGDTAVFLSTAPPPEGGCYWLAPPMNSTVATLSHQFDLTGLEQATLTFDTWFDLEEGWDFAYVTISADGGQSWSILRPHYTVDGFYGPGFTGYSGDIEAGGWLAESLVLDAYVGQQVEIRFEVVTDLFVLGQGFAVDNIAIPELGHFSGAELACGDTGQRRAETAVAGWQGAGFVATGWQLPQKWALRLMTWEGEADTPVVTPLMLDDLNQGEWGLDLANGGVLLITAVTPFTDAEATYWLSVTSGQ